MYSFLSIMLDHPVDRPNKRSSLPEILGNQSGVAVTRVKYLFIYNKTVFWRTRRSSKGIIKCKLALIQERKRIKLSNILVI